MMVFVLIDSSIPPAMSDCMCLEWLAENNVPSTIVFTKADKKTKQSKGEDYDSVFRLSDNASRIDQKKGNIHLLYEKLLVRVHVNSTYCYTLQMTIIPINLMTR